MEIIGIIGEYNPFHKGHLYHIKKIKELYPDSLIILVLNGYFMQRGEISLINKENKTRLALTYGVDLVLELPFIYGSQAADIFAQMALKILNNLGINKLIFGSESNDIEKINSIVDEQLHNPNYNILVKKYLKEGYNYPTSLAKALKQNDFLFLPNDLLAISYVKTIKQNNYHIEAIPIKRTNNYKDLESKEEIISASNIREKLKNNEDISYYVPLETNKYINKINEELLFNILKVKILTCSLNEYLDVDEGIEYRLKKMILKVNNYQELVQMLKTKRYTYNKINRMLMHILIGLKKKDAKIDIDYIKILGFNQKGQNYLKNNNISLKVNKNSLIYQYELKASYIYDILCNDKTSNYELSCKPLFK